MPWRKPLAYLASNIISLIGVVLVTTAGILWLLALPAFWRGEAASPYIGILLFLILPGVFILGLALIPAGIAVQTRKRRKAGDVGPLLPQGREMRRLGTFVAVTTVLNLVIGSQFIYRAVTYMDTDTFCGRACHTVMQPEYVAYSNSSHARVACSECHIGAGASFYVKSKLAGVGQVVAVAFNSYPRPIPSPVADLRPARETCEQCHWPQRFQGNKFFVHTEYGSDEQNTPSTNVALVKIGGSNFSGQVGIHGAHVGDKGRMEYIALDHRQSIPQVTYTESNGKVTVYKATDAKVKPEELASGEHRGMDCMDCHNRPTHTFELPERAVDTAMTQGSISPKLPFIKKEALLALKRSYADRDTAAREIATFLDSFYRNGYPPQVYASYGVALRNAISAVQSIYAQNIFPEMKITWGTYPNNLGHTDFPGCFRCHDGNHTSADGRTISNDCATCHDLVAVGEKNPKIMTELGMNPPMQGSAGGATDK